MDKENTAMTVVPHSHIPYGPEGTAAYTKSQTTVRLAAYECIPIALEALVSMDINPLHTFNIVDYGAADGGVDMPLLYEMVRYLRTKYGTNLPVHVSFEDQPVNDFKSTFLLLEGLLPEQEISSFSADFPNTFVSACGASFYKQCYPPLSVHFGYSSTALHWLQEKPCSLPNATLHKFETDEKSTQLFAIQAAKDWELFLLQRAKELVPGGHLVVATLSRTMFEAELLAPTLRAFVDDGTITEDEFVNTTLAMYFRTVDEVKAPFEEENSAVQKAGLRILSAREKTLEGQLYQQFIEEGLDVTGFARGVVSGFRAWSNSTLLSGLADTRSAQEKTDIVDKFYSRLEQEVAKAPHLYKSSYSHIYVHICKVE
ncbi:Hypp3849 [Branchiostoma lanceolatum]|uniref:Hypp3849 protein n=1 Tax=Branchiostoma lanceolatum TaxID=7740 RepID=A0A8K0ETK7_BRALA|nr:Hypp3849 [Branchiostoma lanceolatum]